MWNPFVKDNNNYLMKYNGLSGDVKFYLTDLKTIWFENIPIKDMFARFQDLNPLLDATEKLQDHITSLIYNIDAQTNINLDDENDTKILELKSKIDGFPIKCKFHMCRGDQDMFFSEVIVPLLQSVDYLETRQKSLFGLLKRKDDEIEEHKMQGGEISRRDLITKKFVKNSYVENYPKHLFLNVLNKSQEFHNTFVDKFGEVLYPRSKVKKDEDHKTSKKLKKSHS